VTTWTDWRGHEYTIGDTVLYARLSGRSCEMAEGVVTDLFEVYYCSDTYKWKRVDSLLGPPFKRKYGWIDAQGKLRPDAGLSNSQARANGWNWEEYISNERCRTERRAKIMPGRTSRFNSYEDRGRKWAWDEATKTGEYHSVPDEDLKPITLKICESITAIVP